MKPANVLNITSLDENWCDKDWVMLHACFQLLKDCIEKENLLNGHIDWENDQESKEVRDRLQKLYDWWEARQKKEKNGELDETNKKVYDDDTEKLVELMKLRSWLWT